MDFPELSYIFPYFLGHFPAMFDSKERRNTDGWNGRVVRAGAPLGGQRCGEEPMFEVFFGMELQAINKICITVIWRYLKCVIDNYCLNFKRLSWFKSGKFEMIDEMLIAVPAWMNHVSIWPRSSSKIAEVCLLSWMLSFRKCFAVEPSW